MPLSNLSGEGTTDVVESCAKLLFPKEDLGGEHWLIVLRENQSIQCPRYSNCLFRQPGRSP